MIKKAFIAALLILAGFASGLKCSDYTHDQQTRTPASQVVPLEDADTLFNMSKDARIIE